MCEKQTDMKDHEDDSFDNNDSAYAGSDENIDTHMSGML